MRPYNVNGSNQPPPSFSSELNAAKVAIIASTLVALGEVTGVFADILALEEESNNNSKNQPGMETIHQKLEAIQEQLDYLTKQVNKR